MASYGKIRETTISGQAGTTWYVELWKKDYTGSVTDLALQGEGFNVNWSGQGGTRDKQFIKSESVLSIYVQNSTDEDLIYDIFSKGDRSYYTRIYKNGQTKSDIWWFGWVNPSFCTIENAPFPYKSSIKSTDSIGTFSKKEESVLEASAIATTHRINSHIKDFGDTMGLYNAPTELVLDGNFPDPNVNWDIESAWSIPTGGGQIDYDASANHYVRTNTGVTSGNDYSFAFNISNLTEGGSAKFTLRVYNGLELFSLDIYTYTSNGNYVIKGECLNTSTGIRVMGLTTSDSFSLTNISLVDGLETNISPCPTNNDWFQTSVDWWRSGDTYQSDDPFYLYRTTKSAYRGDKEQKPRNYKEYDVLKGVLRTFNANCILSNGKYNFIQPNNWLGNTNGILPFYSYPEGGDNRDTTSVSENNLVSINGNTTVGNGAILAGSNLTFEPAFKGVDATFISGAAAVDISPTVDFTTFQTVGQVEASASNSFMYLDMNLRHYETLLISTVDAALGTGYSLRNNLIRTDFAIEIRVINGSTTHYVRKFGNEHIWQTTQAELERNVGRGLEGWSSSNGVDHSYPCSISKGATHYTTKSENQFIPFFPQPPISGDLQIKVTGVNTYNRHTDGDGGYGTPFPVTSAFEVTEENLLASGSKLVNTSTTSESSDEIGITYSSTQTENSAEEQFDLGDIIVGNSSATNINEAILYTVSYGDSIPATSGFRKGGTGTYSNITQLLANEFLKPQIEPLTILQAEIFSPSVNPTSLLKYSINDDGSYNYYTFLGGKFSAQSETMSGEWYKISDSASITIEEVEVKLFSPASDTQVNRNNLEFLSNTNKLNVSSDSLAVTSAAIVAANATTSISIGSSLKSDVAENQKLKLTYPDGSNGITVTVTDGYNDSATSLDVSSFDSVIDYPIGSILSAVPYEAVSLMNRLTTSGNASFRSVGVNNIQEINFLPQDFNFSSSESAYISSIDIGGSAKISDHQAQMLAQKLVSKGKTITKVNVFGSANFSFRVYEGFIFNDTSTLVGTGTVNTELDITDIVGTSRNYITIEIQVSSDTNEVYGGYALVTNT